ncbi:trigger factor [Patescibacteria group bacterium]|nr:trigger factor [Patescibacteria group bacterium]MBU4082864.1 trigger factor [Patescibacteria group bacterium]MCG2809818.1 trigger factor [Candidatus Portnoybacteria bacterium]
MKTQIKDLPKSQKEIEVEISAEKMEGYTQKALSEISKQIKVDGFRPGKTPADIVKQHIGEMGVCQEAGEIAIRETYPQVLKENNLEVIGSPEIAITKIAPGNPLEYKAVVTVLPEVKLSDYKKIKFKLEKVKIKDKQVDGELEKLRKQKAKFITTKEASQKGDRLEIDFDASLNGEKVENGGGKKHPLIIGESRFVPGFEDNLIGLKEGEEKEFSVVFPEKYQSEKLEGKKVDFRVKVCLVQKVELPKIDDEFAKSFGEFKDLESLKKDIKKWLEREAETKARGELREKIIGQVIKESEMDVPELLLEEELNLMMKELQNSVERTGIKFDDYLKKTKANKDEIRKGWHQNAENRVKFNLIIREINKLEKIKVDEKALEEQAEQMLKAYANNPDLAEKVNPEAVREYIRETMIKEKIFQILESASTNNA